MPNAIPSIVYALCAATSIACAIMLYRGFARSGARFLLWSSLCFVCLALNNAMLFVDLVIFPDHDLIFLSIGLPVWRSLAALVGLVLLIYGLVWDVE